MELDLLGLGKGVGPQGAVAQITFESIIHTAYKDGNTTKGHPLTLPIRVKLRRVVDPGVLDEFGRAIKVEGSILTMSAEKDAYANTLFLVRS
ncbi:MAG: hypothetical protein ABSG44_16320 [Thermodesulfobacteriota bacterium]